MGLNTRFSFSSKEDQSHKLEYFKEKLANISPKGKKESSKELNEEKIDDLVKKINFENFDSEINLIIKEKTYIENTKIDNKIQADFKDHSKTNGCN